MENSSSFKINPILCPGLSQFPEWKSSFWVQNKCQLILVGKTYEKDPNFKATIKIIELNFEKKIIEVSVMLNQNGSQWVIIALTSDFLLIFSEAGNQFPNKNSKLF